MLIQNEVDVVHVKRTGQYFRICGVEEEGGNIRSFRVTEATAMRGGDSRESRDMFIYSSEVDFARTISSEAWESLPSAPSEFDAYIIHESFRSISDTSTMEEFLLRGARRYHELDAMYGEALDMDVPFPAIQEQAFVRLEEWFRPAWSDLTIFFREMDHFHEQAPEEQRRLLDVAEGLVGCAKDSSKLVQHEATVLDWRESQKKMVTEVVHALPQRLEHAAKAQLGDKAVSDQSVASPEM